jgi:hypothetical protein
MILYSILDTVLRRSERTVRRTRSQKLDVVRRYKDVSEILLIVPEICAWTIELLFHYLKIETMVPYFHTKTLASSDPLTRNRGVEAIRALSKFLLRYLSLEEGAK